MLTIGSMRPYKGYPYLLNTCAILKQRGFAFHCHIIGDGVDRPLIEAQIKKEALGDYVTLHGALPQERVKDWFQKVDCYLQPSIIAPNKKMEGIPVALMEALASGLPVIASEISGIPELVIPEKTGWLVPEKDTQALADTIIQIRENYEKAMKIGENGRKIVLNEYNIQKNAAKLSDLYRISL